MNDLGQFHHVALTVSDLATSAEWYSTVLGMEQSFREESSARRAAVFRFAAGGWSIGLVEHAGATVGRFDPTVTGLDHVAFSVETADDLRDWAARLDTHGVEHSGPIPVPPGEILNFRDPDGIALALFWDRPI
jgi:glyoxylase I family protein